MHQRQVIREAVLQVLQAHTGLSNRYTGRLQPTGSEKLPFVRVAIAGETSQEHSDQWSEKRTVTVLLALYAKAEEHLDDVLDSLAVTVESLLCQDQTLGGACESLRYKGAAFDFDGPANEIGSLTLSYECVYVWAPAPVLPDFITAQIGIDMASPRNDPPTPTEPDGQLDASVTVTLPTN